MFFLAIGSSCLIFTTNIAFTLPSLLAPTPPYSSSPSLTLVHFCPTNSATGIGSPDTGNAKSYMDRVSESILALISERRRSVSSSETSRSRARREARSAMDSTPVVAPEVVEVAEVVEAAASSSSSAARAGAEAERTEAAAAAAVGRDTNAGVEKEDPPTETAAPAARARTAAWSLIGRSNVRRGRHERSGFGVRGSFLRPAPFDVSCRPSGAFPFDCWY
mmetsp:Transcript_34279/g.70006  ORF Transcript_34279/g.70006 Transcript_34279/m.70006 type:complete len:220 (-) Transcript_34279:168-827(-)